MVEHHCSGPQHHCPRDALPEEVLRGEEEQQNNRAAPEGDQAGHQEGGRQAEGTGVEEITQDQIMMLS